MSRAIVCCVMPLAIVGGLVLFGISRWGINLWVRLGGF